MNDLLSGALLSSIFTDKSVNDKSVNDKSVNDKSVNDKSVNDKSVNDKIGLSKLSEINDSFKMPIWYNKDRRELKKNIADDLELVNAVDESSNPVYSFLFDNDNDVSKKLVEQIVKYYTTDTAFIKDNQKLLAEYTPTKVRYTSHSANYNSIITIWNEIKLDSGFKEKYYYLDWEPVEFLNKSETFLQFISMYNLCSPVFSLLVPIIILIIPFFIIKLRGMNLTIGEYFEVLKIVAQSNAIGKLFTVNLNELTLQEKIYIFVSAAFYLFSIYQNVMVCVRYNKNMALIHGHFSEISVYLKNTIEEMENYLVYAVELESHREFVEAVKTKVLLLKKILQKMKHISTYNWTNVTKVGEIGRVLKYFYELHTNPEYDEALLYSLGFHGYIDCITGLQRNILERKVGIASFTNYKKKAEMRENYYACLKNEKHIKNNIKFKKNIIVTGPNASGKTTVLKSVLINIIITQQFGCGFYKSAKICPFKHIHCYLNIPDTSGRDSLFQAEARRCKDILDCIEENPNDTHFGAFDELYSGTNPEEAETSGTAFLKYLAKRKNVNFLLTTHFINICKNLEENANILNCKMKTEKSDGEIIYKYKLEKGISSVKGGMNVLKALNYPKEIVG